MPSFRLPHGADLIPYLVLGGRLLFIVAGAVVTSFLLRRLVGRLRFQIVRIAKAQHRVPDLEMEKRAATVSGILRTLIAVVISGVALGMCLRELGFDIGPLVAGAGVAGIAVGLGAQNLFRDVISGFFVLIEDQLRVNDIAVINGVSGVVEQLNLRTIVLRDAEGVVHIFPNGAITALANRTREYSYYLFQMGLSYKSDLDRAIAQLRQVDAAIRLDPGFAPFIREPLEVFGVDQFHETGVIVKARIKTEPGRQWEVGREMNLRFKQAFDAAGIEFQTKVPKIEAPQHTAASREELRAIVREVIAEMSLAGPGPRNT